MTTTDEPPTYSNDRFGAPTRPETPLTRIRIAQHGCRNGVRVKQGEEPDVAAFVPWVEIQNAGGGWSRYYDLAAEAVQVEAGLMGTKVTLTFLAFPEFLLVDDHGVPLEVSGAEGTR